MALQPDTQALYTPAILIALVHDYDHDAAAHRKRLSAALQQHPGLFYQAAIETLKKDAESQGAQFLISLLGSRKLLSRVLCDPAIPRERAVAVAQQALRIDPLLDVLLAGEVAEASLAGPGASGPDVAGRLMQILEKISDGKRILPLLMRVLRSNNPYLRSKAVRMIGRFGRRLHWIEGRLEESDTRVRANAVEALWRMEGAEAAKLLRAAARDDQNRVAGNALLGMYWIGDTSALPELVKMAGHPSPACRRTAAWVMGETGDPRFNGLLGELIRDGQAGVRRNARAALKLLRKATAAACQREVWTVAGRCETDLRTCQRTVSVTVLAANGRENPHVLPVQFHLSENGRPVWSYHVTERSAPDAASVSFIFPRTVDAAGECWNRGASRCVEWRRPVDLWFMLPYLSLDQAPAASTLELTSFLEKASGAKNGGFWTALQAAVQPGIAPSRGNRHAIVLAPNDVGACPDSGLTAAARASRTSMQAVSAAPNAALKEVCRCAGGHFYEVSDPAEIEARIAQAYLSVLARYEIRYQSSTLNSALVLHVQTPSGSGETLVALPD